MAILIPSTCHPETSQSERRTFEKLGRELPGDTVVLHSVWVTGGKGDPDRESDIFVLSPLGFFALEVKGGDVSCKDGIWHFESSGGRSYSKKVSPWDQSRKAFYAAMTTLKATRPEFSNILGGWGVIMPYVRFETSVAGCDPEVLLDEQNYSEDILSFIKRLSQHYRNRLPGNNRTPGPDDIARARHLLRPDFACVRPLGVRLDNAERDLIALTERQVAVSRRLMRNPRTIVRGPAGTGKTLIAIDRARQAAASGKRVLFLCFNRNLAAYVRNSLSDPKNGCKELSVDAMTLHACAMDLTKKYSTTEIPVEEREKLFSEAAKMATIKSDFQPWDVLIADEMQDLLNPESLALMDALLRSGLSDGVWHFFMDESQDIFSGSTGESLRQIEDYRPALDYLEHNCRNTIAVSIAVEEYSEMPPGLPNTVHGEYRQTVFFSDDNSFLVKISALLDSLLGDGRLCGNDIMILSTRAFENSILVRVLDRVGHKIEKFDPYRQSGRDTICFSTIHAFKGLDTKVAILIDIESLEREEDKRLLYVGLTRARSLLVPFLHESLKARLNSNKEKMLIRREPEG